MFWGDRAVGVAECALIAMLAALPAIGNMAVERSFLVPKLALAAPLAALALAAAVVAALAGASARGLAREHGLARGALVAAGALVALATVSAILSESFGAALFGTQFRRAGLLAWFTCGAALAAVVLTVRDVPAANRLIDALLIGTIVPVTYALQQRFGLDFYFLKSWGGSRVQGSFGNPNMLAAYLAMTLLPTVARACDTATPARLRAAWGLLGAAQVAVIVFTQSRGALFGLAVAVPVAASCVAARHFAWRRLWGLWACVVTLAAFVVAINVIDGARAWAQRLPLAQRLVVDAGPRAGVETELATRSLGIRLGLWSAGNAALASLDPARLLLGHGPDLAYGATYRHVPVEIIRQEGFRATTNYDRLHADVLDIVLNFGVAGWLAYWMIHSLAIHGAAIGIFGRSAAGRPRDTLALSLGSAAASAGIIGPLFPVVAAPVFGLGACLGWCLYLAICARRHARTRPVAQAGRGPALGYAALLGGLVAFWVEAQVDVPVPSTRLVVSIIAALLAAAATRGFALVHDESTAGSGALIRAAAFGLIGGIAAFLPAVEGFERILGRTALNPWLHAFPLMALGGFVGWLVVARREEPARHGGEATIWAAAVALFALALWAGRVSWDTRGSFAFFGALRNAAWLPVLSIPLACLVAGWAKRGEAGRLTQGQVRGCLAALGLGALLCGVTTVAAMRLYGAEVAVHVAGWTAERSPSVAGELRERAVAGMPFEREFHRHLVFGRLEAAVAGISGARDPIGWRQVADGLRSADEAGRVAAARFPDDPWILLAHANVLQVRALRQLRTIDDEGARVAENEARMLLRRASERFPTQPQIYRIWAHLENEAGNRGSVEALLDRMEALIPASPEPYVDRVTMALGWGDMSVVRAARARAARHLSPSHLAEVDAVAVAQQK
jgi:hypothetical protein